LKNLNFSEEKTNQEPVIEKSDNGHQLSGFTKSVYHNDRRFSFTQKSKRKDHSHALTFFASGNAFLIASQM